MTFRFLALFLFSIGCGGSPVGGTCNSDKGCEEGLECLGEDVATATDQPPWCEGDQFCSVSCEGDKDCTDALGAGHICIADCGPGRCFVGTSSTITITETTTTTTTTTTTSTQ